PWRLNGDGTDTVKTGVRPEKIRRDRDEGRPPAGTNCVTGTLVVTAFVGVSHQYTVDGPGGRKLTVYAQNIGAQHTPQPGERVRLSWNPEQTFVVRPSGEPGEREEEP